MIKKYLIILSTLAFTLFFCLPNFSFAGDEASVSLEPKNPPPYTQVTATLVSYSFDVNTALIVWSTNGKELLKGVGEKKLTLQTGGSGSRIPVHIKATTPNNSIVDIDITIAPGSVDLIYETPESYTPLFYEGRTLPGEGSMIKLVAMPNITEKGVVLPPSSISYSWYVNDEFIDDSSGIGKQSALLGLDYLSSYTTFKVVAHGPYGTVAEKSIDIYPHDVMPLLYKYDDVLGTDHTSTIERRFETTKDFTLSLEPFYLSTNGSFGDTATYDWSLDGLPITPLGGTLLAMHPKENSYGSRNLSISIANSQRRLQKADIDLSLIFDTR